MIVKMYAVLDHKIKDWHLSIFDIEDAGAIRQFSDAVASKETRWNKHPEDYSLWYVGKFDTSKGVVMEDTPGNLINALATIALEKKIEQPFMDALEKRNIEEEKKLKREDEEYEKQVGYGS